MELLLVDFGDGREGGFVGWGWGAGGETGLGGALLEVGSGCGRDYWMQFGC